jgi:hypothetical protein
MSKPYALGDTSKPLWIIAKPYPIDRNCKYPKPALGFMKRRETTKSANYCVDLATAFLLRFRPINIGFFPYFLFHSISFLICIGFV